MDDAERAIQRILREMRRHLGMEVAFVSELRAGERIFRYVDTDLAASPVQVGEADPAEASFCHSVVAGDIPELLRDARQHPVAAQLEATWQVPIGTHVSVPIIRADGTVYGTFCCFSREVDDAVADSVSDQHLAALRVIADILADHLEGLEATGRDREVQRQRVASLTVGRDLRVACQPIVRLHDGCVVGMEALARFPTLDEDPRVVFGRAWDAGVGLELELLAAEAALAHLDRLPADTYLAVNVAPATLASDRFLEAVGGSQPDRIVVEVTEHAAVEDYDALRTAARTLTDLGVRVAIDDVGTGFSSLSHIIQLSPPIIKVDGSLVRGVAECTAKQAMLSALVTFGARMGTTVVAEGVESEAELTALRVLGVDHGQGFHLACPRHLHAVPRAAASSDVTAASE